ncbi:MAG: EutN/CcmL family microcompartment protein [Fuerstiella sp.]|nr:EutN/CcmL family microcompartment protein [Fuerstiella sp.]MCP4854350.1 EutN/CcmL family microcompartment protein [Fuerstiella sp.]
MQAARVIGNATATVKHPSLDGWRLVALQPVDINNEADGFPFLAIDSLGAGNGEMVFFTSDGKTIRGMVGRNDCPIRYAVQGIIDNQTTI